MKLDREKRKRLMFIVNPVSGKKQIQRTAIDITKKFVESGYEVSLYPTFARGDATEYAKEFADEFDAIVCAGGDGTLNETISGVIEGNKDIVIGYIPCGSTNDFSICHGLSQDNITAASDAVRGTVHEVDIGKFESDGNTRYFTYVAAFGAFSWLSYSTPQNMKNILGHTAYVLDAIVELPQIKSEHLRITADGEVYEGDYIFGAVCNSTSVAGILSIPSEKVELNDGKFELLLVDNPEGIQDLSAVADGLLGHNYEADGVKLIRAEHITVESEGEVRWALDGEYACADKILEITNLKGRMKLRS